MHIATDGLNAAVPHVLNAGALGDSDRDDVLGRVGECVEGRLPVGDDADGADGTVEAEVTDKFGQTGEIRLRRNHDVHRFRHTYLYDHIGATRRALWSPSGENSVLSELSQKASQFVIEINETSDEGKVSKISDKITERLKGFWRHHKVWSLIIAYLLGMLVILPAIGILVGFIKDGKDPVTALKAHAVLLGRFIGLGVILVIAVLFFFSSSPVGGSPKGNVLKGNALSNLVNRSSVHPQSDYRAQDRAAQEARNAAAQGREALSALERAGGDPSTIQKLQSEINQADRDAKTFQEWADD